ncbi:hypothetical protein [Sphingobacterium sp. SRCM116780]|nr:hypothetical protein [Sphingobacterium sp. SRCM116780]
MATSLQHATPIPSHIYNYRLKVAIDREQATVYRNRYEDVWVNA